MKIIAEFRGWFPNAFLVGWKFEVEGDRERAILMARKQIESCQTNASVANGPAYGAGFGLAVGTLDSVHLPDHAALFATLAELLGQRSAS